MYQMTLRNIDGEFEVRINTEQPTQPTQPEQPEQDFPNKVIETFKKVYTVNQRMTEYTLLMEQEQIITKKRTSILADLKTEFIDFAKDEYPEYFL